MSQEMDQKEARVTRVRLTLDDWKEVLVVWKRVLDWEQPYHPGLIFGLVSVHFLLNHWLQPSFPALVAVTCLKLTLADYLMPLLGPRIFPMEKWGSKHEHEFNVICEAISDMHEHVWEAFTGLREFRAQCPRVYKPLSVGLLSLVCYLGWTLGDVFVLYVILLLALLYPGARKTSLYATTFSLFLPQRINSPVKNKND